MKKNRIDFPYLLNNPSYIYLDSAATTQKPKSVILAINSFYADSYATVHRGIYQKGKEATELYEGVRRKAKHFLGARHESEIVFTRGTTASLNLVARSFGAAFLKKGDIVITTPFEHHSNLVPWHLLEQEVGIQLEFMKMNECGEIDLSDLEARLNDRVKLVTLAHVSNVLGTIHPLKEVARLSHRVGAKVCVDGAQSAAHMPLNLADDDIDFFACSSHKMYGPTGLGLLYGKKELLEKMPPIEGGGDMIEKVSLKKTIFAPPPLRFEAGTPMISSVIGFGAALDYLTNVGLDHVERDEKELTEYAMKRLSKVENIKILGPHSGRGAIISFTIEGLHPLDVATMLDCKNIALRSGHHCSQPTMDYFGIESALRISFGLYNTKEEIDHFISSLQEVIDFLSSQNNSSI